jgi:hypothetical protein
VDNVFWTAITDVVSAKGYDKILSCIDDGAPLVNVGVIDDGVLVTGELTGLAREGINAGDDSSAESETECVEIESACQIFSIDDALQSFDEMTTHQKVNEELKASGNKKQAPILSVDLLMQQNEKAFHNDPNYSGKTKLRQLERHQRLHLLYEEGKLRKCLLSYFLKVVSKDCLSLLSWMGSKLASHIPKPAFADLPVIPALRLAKIPTDYGVCGDKGFTNIKVYLPNVNIVATPPAVVNSKTHRLSSEMIELEIPVTTVRAPCETAFAHIQSEAILTERVPYHHIPFINHGHMLGLGEANLCQPLRRPGRNAIVGDDYWSNQKEYTTIEHGTRSETDVTQSARRICASCKHGDIVLHCQACNYWFHLEGDCHDFDTCTGGGVRNPYIK